MRLHPKDSSDQNRVQLSQSALEAFFQCPARLKYMSQWSTKTLSRELQDGVDAHALLTGIDVPTASPRAIGYYESLFDLAAQYGIELIGQEVTQYIELGNNIVYKRIIDGVGTWHGQPVLIDWKTSGKGPWPTFAGPAKTRIAPKARTFQGVSYLLPPSDEEIASFGFDEWPYTMLFLVSDASGHGEAAAYTYDQADADNFYAACDLVAHAIRTDNFPHVRGGVCGLPGTSWQCSYLHLCYQLPGWEAMYTQLTGEEVH